MDYRPLALGLVLGGVGVCGLLLAPTVSLGALALALLGLALYHWTPIEDRRVVFWVFGISLAFRLALLYVFYMVQLGLGHHGFLSGDEALYFERAGEFSDYLKGATDSPFSHDHGINGYVYFNGFVFGLTSPSILLPRVLNVCVGLAATFGFYRWTRNEFGRRAGLLVLVLIAFYPSLLYWSITSLKEPHLIFFLLMGMWSAHRLCGVGRSWFLWAMAVGGAIVIIVILGTYNLYLAATLGFAVAFGWLLARYPRQVVLASTSALVGGIWLYWTDVSVAEAVSEVLYPVAVRQDALARSDFAGYVLFPYDHFRNTYPNHFGPHNELYWAAWLASWLKGLGYFLFSPFPWAIKSLGQLQAYPQIILWYGLFPFVPYGAWVLLRAGCRQILPLVVFLIILVAFLALVSGNMGEAFRHRDWISPFCLMFAGVGILHFFREPELLARLKTFSSYEAAD